MEEVAKTKVCTKCREEKELSAFGKGKNRKDGLSYWCKKCEREYGKEYRKLNANKRKEYLSINADKIREQRKEYCKLNADRIMGYEKKYRNSINGTYVKRQLQAQNFPSDLITPELVEAKRALIQLKRAIKQSN